MKSLWPLGQYLNAVIYTLPRGSALCIYNTLNLGGGVWIPGFRAPFPNCDSSARNRHSGLGSSPLPHGIAVPAWNRRQSHTESPFWSGIGDSPTQNRRSGLGSATVPHRIAVLAWDRRQSRMELPLRPRIAAASPQNYCSRLSPLPHARGASLQGGKFRRLLNPKGVRAGWVVGSDAR